MNTIECKGSCLCGAVRVSAAVQSRHLGACHCTMCQKWGGGPLMTIESMAVHFEGEENITVYNSSTWAERGFCAKCGSHLFYRLKNGPRYFLPLGIVNDGKEWSFDHQIFIDEKPASYAFANQTKTMTGAEVFAQFAPEGESS